MSNNMTPKEMREIQKKDTIFVVCFLIACLFIAATIVIIGNL